MKKAIVGVLILGIMLSVVGCGKEKAVYYSEIKNKNSEELSKDESRDKNTNTDKDDKNGIMNLFGKKTDPENYDGNMVNGGYITIDEENYYFAIYWYQFGEAYLYCRNNNGVDTQIIKMDGRIENICITEDRIYFTNDGLYSVNKDGSNLTKLIDEDINNGVYQSGEYIYYGNKYRLRKDGSDITEVGTESIIIPYTLNCYENYYYYNESDGNEIVEVKRRKMDESKSEMLMDGGSGKTGTGIRNMIVYDDHIYYIMASRDENIRHTIYRCELDGDNNEEWAHTDADIGYINAYNGKLYYTGIGITQIDIDTGEQIHIYDQSAAYKLQIIGDWVYFLKLPNGVGSDTIYRVKTDGSTLEKYAGVFTITE